MQVNETCAQGHDLTVEGAFAYSPTGLRFCRLCHEAKNPKRRRRTDDIGSINRWTG